MGFKFGHRIADMNDIVIYLLPDYCYNIYVAQIILGVFGFVALVFFIPLLSLVIVHVMNFN